MCSKQKNTSPQSVEVAPLWMSSPHECFPPAAMEIIPPDVTPTIDVVHQWMTPLHECYQPPMGVSPQDVTPPHGCYPLSQGCCPCRMLPPPKGCERLQSHWICVSKHPVFAFVLFVSLSFLFFVNTGNSLNSVKQNKDQSKVGSYLAWLLVLSWSEQETR